MAITDPKCQKENNIHFPGWLSNLDVTKSLWPGTVPILESWDQHFNTPYRWPHPSTLIRNGYNTLVERWVRAFLLHTTEPNFTKSPNPPFQCSLPHLPAPQPHSFPLLLYLPLIAPLLPCLVWTSRLSCLLPFACSPSLRRPAQQHFSKCGPWIFCIRFTCRACWQCHPGPERTNNWRSRGRKSALLTSSPDDSQVY